MPFNLLLLPFLGGYIFIRNWNRTKFYIIRSDKERLLIYASIAGAIFVLFSYFLYLAGLLIKATVFDPCEALRICPATTWNATVDIPYSGVAFVSFVLGLTVWWPFNRFFNYRRLSPSNLYTVFDPNHWAFFDDADEIQRVILKDENPLEMLLYRSQQPISPEKKRKLVAVSMKDSKVYVGKVSSISDPGRPTSHISLLPYVSGYREKETREVGFTTDYRPALAEVERQGRHIILQATQAAVADKNEKRRLVEMWEELRDVSKQFVLVIPVDQISSICYFDFEIHEKFFS